MSFLVSPPMHRSCSYRICRCWAIFLYHICPHISSSLCLDHLHRLCKRKKLSLTWSKLREFYHIYLYPVFFLHLKCNYSHEDNKCYHHFTSFINLVLYYVVTFATIFLVQRFASSQPAIPGGVLSGSRLANRLYSYERSSQDTITWHPFTKHLRLLNSCTLGRYRSGSCLTDHLHYHSILGALSYSTH